MLSLHVLCKYRYSERCDGRLLPLFVGAGADMEVDLLRFCERPNVSRAMTPAGAFSNGGVAAVDCDAGVPDCGCPASLSASENAPPLATIDHNDNSTQTHTVFIALPFLLPVINTLFQLSAR
jgi:hypothetical protein